MAGRSSAAVASAKPEEPAVISVCDATFECDRTGALWWPDEQTLIVADLHLEKGSAFARKGAFLPPYDTTETLRRLSGVVARKQPETIVLLGDSFHDVGGTDRLSSGHRETLRDLQHNRNWIWITGNHDPDICDSLGGEVVDGLVNRAITFRHEPGPLGTPAEIAGHFHPCARIVHHGRSIRRRCFVTDGERLVMPAFGAYTGGLNVCDTVFANVFAGTGAAYGAEVWMLGQDRVYPMSGSALKPD